MSNKLRKMKLTSVDFVGAGANQDAHIMLKKNRSQEDMEKTLWEKFKTFMKGEYTEAEIEAYSINKAKQSVKDENQLYTEVLKESIDSIVQNDTLSPSEKTEMMRKSLDEFTEAFDGAIENWSELTKSVDEESYLEQKGREMVIDTEKLTAEEREIYKALTQKAQVTDEEVGDEELADQIPEEPKEEPKEDELEKEDDIDLDKCGDRFKKEDEELDKCSDKVKKSIMDEMEDLKKNIQMLERQKDMDELTAVAKKYEPLGKDTKELAETLYELKKSAPNQYDKFIGLLDENLDVVNKSGLFTEIGKSGHIGARTESTVAGKIDAKASEIMKSNPEMSVFEAREKAWQTSPELAKEYEEDYLERR